MNHAANFVATARTNLHRVALAFCLLFFPIFSAYAQSSTAVTHSHPQDTPEAAVTAFYGWYLGALAKDRVPLRDDRKQMQSFVVTQLLKKIEHGIKNGEADSDYFTRAQDYFDDWASNIAVSDVRISGNTASTIVTLGNSKESRHGLAVQLVKEGDGWKISSVNDQR